MRQKTVTVSVRHLVEFILRSGDLVSGGAGLAEVEAMQKGSRAHRRLQKAAGPSYQAEVSLEHTTVIDDDLVITVSGRADGVITESVMRADENGVLSMQNVITIDEIKGTYKDPGHITEPVPVHLAQAMCYAFFYADQNDLPVIDVQMTYVHLDKATVKQFRETLTFGELSFWYQELIGRYADWIRWQAGREEERDASIAAASFPYAYREGQKKLVSGIYQTIVRQKRLFALAPTGTGKTMAAVYPALQTMGRGMTEKIFYLTARTIARTVAEDAFATLQAGGLTASCVTLTARDKICIFDKAVCDPALCPRAKGHFDRVNEALWDILHHEKHMTLPVILSYAEKHRVCPFEYQLDIALFTDAVICDYNYVFDPDARLQRFFGDRAGDYCFLVDEAHNLVDRARDMFSARLTADFLKNAAKALKGTDRRLSSRLGQVNRYFDELAETAKEGLEIRESIGALMALLTRLNEVMEELLRGDLRQDRREPLLDLYFEVRRFLMTYDRSDDRYLTYTILRRKYLVLKIACMDPSRDIGEALKKGRSAIFFSATLLPAAYYKQMLSDTAREDFDMAVASPFDPSRQLVLAADDVTTRYSARGPALYERLAEYIRRIIRSRRGNYLVFFPSYQMMADVFECFSDKTLRQAGHGLRVIRQESEMAEADRQAFLDAFQEDPSVSVIGFCVMGGIFAEGIDLKADRLIGVIIAGTGLPQVGDERELLKAYFDQKTGDGFAYAYLYPGMNKVLQAGGRVIRTEEDTGVIALLDERFLYSQYRQLMPESWEPLKRTGLADVSGLVESFWTERT